MFFLTLPFSEKNENESRRQRKLLNVGGKNAPQIFLNEILGQSHSILCVVGEKHVLRFCLDWLPSC